MEQKIINLLKDVFDIHNIRYSIIPIENIESPIYNIWEYYIPKDIVCNPVYLDNDKTAQRAMYTFINDIINSLNINDKIDILDININQENDAFILQIKYNISPWYKNDNLKFIGSPSESIYTNLKGMLKRYSINLIKLNNSSNCRILHYTLPYDEKNIVNIDSIFENNYILEDIILQYLDLKLIKYPNLPETLKEQNAVLIMGQINIFKYKDLCVIEVPVLKGIDMPTYTFECVKEDGGCGEIFEEYMLMSDYSENNFPHCPKCQNRRFIRRNFAADTTRGFVETNTLGSLAEKNTDKMSDDQKQVLYEQHHDYLINKNRPELPKHMQYLQDPSRFKQR
jgi:predicted nucleic acid-binding Zn ribbon protein